MEKHTIVLYKDWTREFIEWETKEFKTWAEIVYTPYLTKSQVSEIKQSTKDKLQILLKKYS